MYSCVVLCWAQMNNLKQHVYDHLRAWSIKIQESCKTKHGIKIHSPKSWGKHLRWFFIVFSCFDLGKSCDMP